MEPSPPSGQATKVVKRSTWSDAETRDFLQIFKAHYPFLSDPRKRNKQVWAEVADDCKERGMSHVDSERVENKWKALKNRYLSVKDYNEGTGKEGPRKTFRYEAEVGEILGERPNVRPLCMGSSRSSCNEVPMCTAVTLAGEPAAAAMYATTDAVIASSGSSSIQPVTVIGEDEWDRGSESPVSDPPSQSAVLLTGVVTAGPDTAAAPAGPDPNAAATTSGTIGMTAVTTSTAAMLKKETPTARPRRRLPKSTQNCKISSPIDKLLEDRERREKDRAAEKRAMHEEKMNMLERFLSRQ
eukprot:scpid89481/ scgid22480/ 